jgi:hypothetical protein
MWRVLPATACVRFHHYLDLLAREANDPRLGEPYVHIDDQLVFPGPAVCLPVPCGNHRSPVPDNPLGALLFGLVVGAIVRLAAVPPGHAERDNMRPQDFSLVVNTVRRSGAIVEC